MKRAKHTIIGSTILGLIMLFVPAVANSETATQTATMMAGVINIFSIEFYTDANVLYSTSIPFTNIDSSRSLCYADGRTENDGKADTGVLCRSNLNITWYLKMEVVATSAPAFPLANFKFYMGQPWNRTLSQSADGTLTRSPAWYPVPTAPNVVYTAGLNDKNNLAYGTLATLSFSIDPTGIVSGRAYSMGINYTLTTSP